LQLLQCSALVAAGLLLLLLYLPRLRGHCWSLLLSPAAHAPALTTHHACRHQCASAQSCLLLLLPC
jgi:hypothetical protein